mgnify:FL=1
MLVRIASGMQGFVHTCCSVSDPLFDVLGKTDCRLVWGIPGRSRGVLVCTALLFLSHRKSPGVFPGSTYFFLSVASHKRETEHKCYFLMF